MELEIEIGGAVDETEAIDECAGFVEAVLGKGCGERAFVAAGEADEPGREFGEIVECGSALSLGCLAHLEARDELAEVLVAGLRGTEEQKARWLGGMLVGQPGGRREAAAVSAY